VNGGDGGQQRTRDQVEADRVYVAHARLKASKTEGPFNAITFAKDRMHGMGVHIT
jgi:hypothetical protein